MNTHGLARVLIVLWRYRTEEWQKNRRTKAFTVAEARFNGACKAAHAVGFGLTAAHVSSIVRENIYATAGNDLGRWLQSEVIEEVADRLAKVNYVSAPTL